MPLSQIPSNYSTITFKNQYSGGILTMDKSVTPPFNIDENSINTLRILNFGTTLLNGGIQGSPGFLDLGTYFYATFIDLYYGAENLKQRIQIQDFTKINDEDDLNEQIPEGKLVIMTETFSIGDNETKFWFFRDKIIKSFLSVTDDYYYYEITEPEGHFHHFFPGNNTIFFHTNPIYKDDGTFPNNHVGYRYYINCIYPQQ